MADLKTQIQKTKHASSRLVLLKEPARKKLLNFLAESLLGAEADILKANQKDLKKFTGEVAVRQRLELNKKKIEQLVLAVKSVANQEAVVGKVLETRVRPNGLVLKKLSVPLGVVGVIYESRPNVTVDLAALGLKSGNALVLKGGKESYLTNLALVKVIHKVLKKFSLATSAVCLVNPFEEWKETMFKAHGLIDVIVPRGGEGLISFVRENSRLPVIETGAGVCHILVDESANLKQGAEIIVNSKTQSPGVCNSLDTLVVHEKILAPLWALVAAKLAEFKVEIFADAVSYTVLKSVYPSDLLFKAKAENFGHEFLALKMSVKTVQNFEQGLEFIKKYTSGHSESVLTANAKHSKQFLAEVDAAVVYHNASLRFTDGGEFGLGSEVGISTQKLHARGPMGAESLTSYKWLAYGKGQVRV